ncbi:hypothetical protein WN55_09571 [Dufourea novaeangliae]|uniref:Uncharacterized protein n=1 Tax=Dufourea novaeangliae TaxID=178035 RepID=A0A154NYX5_DUFNO|nr:hypothetical protein WN55_09571 [Dufourea novaeangliae]
MERRLDGCARVEGQTWRCNAGGEEKRAAKHRERNSRRKAYALARFSSNFVLRPA